MENLDLIRAERLAVADFLETLTDEQWTAPSLCGKWTVRQVAAHLMVGPTGSLGGFLMAMVRGRGNFHRANDLLASDRAKLPTAQLIDDLRTRAGSTFAPPTYDWQSPLSDLLIHGQDMARPLGVPFDRPLDSWSLVLTFLVSPKAEGAFVPKGAPEVTWRATDVEWSSGTGPEVSGPAASLGLVLAGRSAALEDLSGPGIDQVSAWLTK